MADGDRRGNQWNHGTAALFCRRDGDLPPPLRTAAALERSQRHFRACRDDRLDRSHAHHGRVAHDLVHLVAFENSLGERHGNARLGRGGVSRGADSHGTTRLPDLLDDGVEFVAGAVEDDDRCARLQSQNTGQVLRLVWRQRRDIALARVRTIEPRPHGGDYRTYNLRVFFQGQTIGKYKILSPLGSGGFGSVYLAEDTWIDKKVALKVPHKQNLDFTEMVKEPRLLASLSHPNIVTVLTAERQDHVFFIVMEYVPGETLEHIIMREGALDVGRALDFSCQICNAVDHAHHAGVIHRDLRPGNMLVSESGMLKVTDFGTSRFLEIAAHGTTVIGSPPYMAPEQFHGKAVFASDVYSIGVTMYQMLTGVLPYDTPSPADLEKLMRGELVTAPRLKNSRIPKAINDIVMRALSPDLTVRYPRSADLLEAVLAERGAPMPRRAPLPPSGDVQEIQARLRAREPLVARFCWHCRKPLHARTDRCPFCGEAQ
jgi:eukaryotic-like serine/threonine-protein kinase